MSAGPVLVLAPIHGITDACYRAAFAKCFGGFARAIAPFIPLRHGQRLRPGELAQVSLENRPALPTVPQVLTNHAETFMIAMRQLRDAGHGEVNWNLGCPYPMVAGRGRGAGLLAQPARIDEILATVLARPALKLSVKIRLGYESPDEFRKVMEVLNRHPLAEVTLHPRTATQMYDGRVDLDRAAEALALCRHPFVYSGDITGVAVLNSLRQRLPGTTAWMIGRGVLACPFLPALAGGAPLPEPETRRKKLRDFHDQLFDGYSRCLCGPGHLMDKMLAQWEYLSLSFAQPHQLLKRLHRTNAAHYDDAVQWAFDQPVAEIGK